MDQQADLDEEIDEDDQPSLEDFGGREATLFLIQYSESMNKQHILSDTGSTPSTSKVVSGVSIALELLRSHLRQLIIRSSHDLVALAFCGTKETKNSGDFKHIYVIDELGEPNLDRMKLLDSLLTWTRAGKPPSATQSLSKLTKLVGDPVGDSDWALGDALWTAQNLFSQCHQKLSLRRVLFFTDTANPHSTDRNKQRAAIAKAADLTATDIELNVVPLVHSASQPFSAKVFFETMLEPEESVLRRVDLSDAGVLDVERVLNSVLVSRRASLQRAWARIPFALGPACALHVGIYAMVRPIRIPSAVKLDKRSNEPLQTISRTYVQETCEMLLPQDIKRAVNVGRRRIPLENEQVKQLRMFGDASLRLVGFKPRKQVKSWQFVKAGYFVFPDEKGVRGSMALFTSLLARCAARQVVPLCEFIGRRFSPPRLCYLLPQVPESGQVYTSGTVSSASSTRAELPSGFQIFFLPFTEDVRKYELKIPEDMRASPEEVQAAVALVKALEPLSPEPGTIANPKVERHWAAVEALARDLDAPATTADRTEPKREDMSRVAARELLAFESATGLDQKAADGSSSSKSRKRKADDPATTASQSQSSSVEVARIARQGQLNRLTVEILKGYCDQEGLHVGGGRGRALKRDYIDAINSHLNL